MMDGDADFSQQQRVWEEWAQADPLWAILSEPDYKGGNWDLTEFFATGEHNIQIVMDELAQRGLSPATRRCLDFGCGVGRLTQALAGRFERCDGVDISETMVELARQYNKHGDRCQYHVNVEPDLALFDSESFDFIYSTIVLQHNPPDNAERYIQEFCRLLAPAGIAVFDMTSTMTIQNLPAGSYQAEVEIRSTIGQLRVGESAVIEVAVTNSSGIDWPAGCSLAVGNHWHPARSRRTHIHDDGRATLPHGLGAGETAVVQLTVIAPPKAGPYSLQVDLVEEGVTWFAEQGSRQAAIAVNVQRTERTRRKLSQRLQPQPEAPQPTSAEPEYFTMNGLPRERVEAAVAGAGCIILEAAPNGKGGVHWEGYQYFVTKPVSTSDSP